MAKPSLFSRKMEEVGVFVNVACLYLRIKMKEKSESTKMAWVLSYVQREIAEAWKDNLLDELSKRESEVEMVEELFSKMKNEFRETVEEERKVEQLRTIKQREKTYNKYVQEFIKIARESRYEK